MEPPPAQPQENGAPTTPAHGVHRGVYRVARRRVAEPPATSPPNGTAAPPAGGAPADGEGGEDTAARGRPPRVPRIVVGTEGERTVRPGGHSGDRAVRIVRPRLPGLRATAPGYVLVEEEPEARGNLGRSWRRVKRALIGRPIRSAHEVHERLTKVKALAVFSAD